MGNRDARGRTGCDDCASDMSAHCDRLEKLEDKVSENSEKLAAIEQYHTMINVPILKK